MARTTTSTELGELLLIVVGVLLALAPQQLKHASA